MCAATSISLTVDAFQFSRVSEGLKSTIVNRNADPPSCDCPDLTDGIFSDFVSAACISNLPFLREKIDRPLQLNIFGLHPLFLFESIFESLWQGAVAERMSHLGLLQQKKVSSTGP